MKKLLFCFFGLFLFTACFALPVEEPVLPPPIVEVADPRIYRLVTVERGDVSRYMRPSAQYVPARE